MQVFGWVQLPVFSADQGQYIGVVAIAKIDHASSFFGDRHRRNNGVELALFQPWNHAVPCLWHDAALCLHLLTERISDINIKPL